MGVAFAASPLAVFQGASEAAIPGAVSPFASNAERRPKGSQPEGLYGT
jgi:hypothetical protein